MEQFLKSLTLVNADRLAEFEGRLGYRFNDRSLLQLALVHSSYAFEQNEAGNNNERLEFLGDAVLDLAIGRMLFTRYPEMREGELTRVRAALVNEGNLAAVARGVTLGEFLYLGKGEEASAGMDKASILSGAFEAVVGAIYLDSAYDRVSEFIERYFGPMIRKHKEDMLSADPKSRLQEKIQAHFNLAPEYLIVMEEGPSHNKSFTAAVFFKGVQLGTGTAGSKKEAERLAAVAALGNLKELLDIDP